MKNKTAHTDRKYNFLLVDHKLTWGGAAEFKVKSVNYFFYLLLLSWHETYNSQKKSLS